MDWPTVSRLYTEVTEMLIQFSTVANYIGGFLDSTRRIFPVFSAGAIPDRLGQFPCARWKRFSENHGWWSKVNSLHSCKLDRRHLRR